MIYDDNMHTYNTVSAITYIIAVSYNYIYIYIYIISARYLLRQVRYEVASYDIMFLDTTNINRFWNHVSTTYDFDNCIITCTTIVYKFFLVYMYFFLHILHFNRIFPYHLVI